MTCICWGDVSFGLTRFLVGFCLGFRLYIVVLLVFVVLQVLFRFCLGFPVCVWVSFALFLFVRGHFGVVRTCLLLLRSSPLSVLVFDRDC